MKNSKFSPEYRHQIRKETDREFTGKIKALYESFAFVESPSLGDTIYTSYNNLITDEKWESLYTNCEVSFKLAFTVLGPRAHNVKKTQVEDQQILF